MSEINHQHQQLISNEDIFLWRNNKVTEKFFEILGELEERANLFLQNEGNYFKEDAIKQYGHAYGALSIIRLLKHADLETANQEDREDDERDS